MTPGPADRGDDPLAAGLAEENRRLREENRVLREQVRAGQLAQAQLARHLRVTAPLRRVQELLRHVAGERRRAAGGTAGARSPAPAQPRPLAISAEQAAQHPLLARTRAHQSGAALTPAPDIRPRVTGRSGRVLVMAHVFYPDLWPELAERIERIPAPVDLVVTLVEGHSVHLADAAVDRFPGAVIEVVPNRGRDMWPMVRVLELGLVGDHDAVLKLHTKSSTHRIDGDRWRTRLLDSLCPSPEGIDLILELLRSEPGVGMVAPAGAVLGREFWGANSALVDALATRTGITVDPETAWFPGGSMFWCRPDPLNRLRDAQLTMADFEHEATTLDGTTAHALERFVGALVVDSGAEVIGADEVAGRVAQARSREHSTGAGPTGGGDDHAG